MNEETDIWVEVADLHEFFDIQPDEAQMIEECHKKGHGIEGQIYEYAAFHYAYSALMTCSLKDLMSSDQVNHAQLWVKEIFLGLMRRTPLKVAVASPKGKGGGGSDDEESGEDLEEEIKQ